MFWKKQPVAMLAGLLLLHVLAHTDRYMLIGFSPQIIKDLALSNTQYGFLVGAVWVLSFGCMAIFMGSLADRFSRTRVIGVGVLIWSVCTWASGYAQNFEHMVVARFFVASGEAALVPAATALLSELFDERRRSTAIGVFFMGIPLGIGCAFLLAGVVGPAFGWRGTFHGLGVVGVALALPLLLLFKDDRAALPPQERGAPFRQQVRAAMGLIGATPALRNTIVGFTLTNMIFAGLSFTPLWLINERGMEAASITARLGSLQLVFGALGAVFGGALCDRYTRRFSGGPAGFAMWLIVLCAPLMLAYRFAQPGSPLFYVGMCAGFFLPLALYGPATNAIMGLTPPQMRSTISGFTMLCINVFAAALGNMALGAVSDRLAAAGSAAPLSGVLLGTDLLAIAGLLFFGLAARGVRPPAPGACLKQAQP